MPGTRLLIIPGREDLPGQGIEVGRTALQRHDTPVRCDIGFNLALLPHCPGTLSKHPLDAAGKGGAPLVSWEGHSTGSIVRVSMHDFLVHEDLQLLPGPGMNLVQGPHASSFASAVAVALNGAPLVGRIGFLSRVELTGSVS